MLEVYRGSTNQWECDEMNHMNVRFYSARFMEGLGVLAAHCGMPDAFTSRALSTLAPSQLHIRYHKEARAGAALYMMAGLLDVRESSAHVYMELRHLNGDICATFRAMIDHVDVLTRQAFAWSPTSLAAFEKIRTTAPAETGPRSIDMTKAPAQQITLEEADAIGAFHAGMFTVSPQHCDVNGLMSPDIFIARTSDSAGVVMAGYAPVLKSALEAHNLNYRPGLAALEHRVCFRGWPRAGQPIAVRAGLGPRHGKAFSIRYWMLDPCNGTAWASIEAIVLCFDLDTRRAFAMPEEAREQLEKLAPKGLDV
ncbi:MAG: acyl-[acyl-carrier-protein] thioesterase [Hirschia sp.]|nr:acyl-[acyl-carrier-protein] thioesterase [Hirschia sp.]MBF16990.1 acyl-[acyl-carrier-protein] thioesterase [Hirschia sp.]|tara:strand:+ start:705 stop:1634 length:930 start_codon:yes stop_codon:yes gene_type:complete